MRSWLLFVGLWITAVCSQTFYTSPANWTRDVSTADASGYQSVTLVLQDGLYTQKSVAFGNVPSWNFLASGTGAVISGALTATKAIQLTLSGLTFTSTINSTLSIDLIVNNCNFINSSSGSISTVGNVSGSTFQNNANGIKPGAAISNTGGSVSVSGCTFSNHTSTGAIYVSSGTLLITNSLFKYNSIAASYNGGAVYTVSTSVTINSCTFVSNSAGVGGSIFASASQLVLSSSSFQSEQATYGGSLSVSSSSVVVLNSNFTRGMAQYGGGIYGTVSTVVVRGSSFTGMNTQNSGGGIFFYGSMNATITDSIFSCESPPARASLKYPKANTATYGAGIDLGSGGGRNNLTVTRCTFTGNTALLSNTYSAGGAIRSTYAFLTLQNSTFSSNLAYQSGGGVFVVNTAATVDNCTFSNHSATSGGAIATQGSSSVTMTRSTLSLNGAGKWINGGCDFSGFGGGVHVQVGTTITIDGNTLRGNKANYGGSIHSSSTTYLRNNIFVLNSATNGGAFYLSNLASSVATFSSCIFNNNSASSNGGALYLDETSTFNVSTSSFSYNYGSLSGFGGVVYAGYASGTIDQSIFSNNGNPSADGSIYVFYAGYIAVTNTAIHNNFANRLLLQNLSLYNNDILDRTSVFILASNFVMRGVNIYANRGGSVGAAVAIFNVQTGAVDNLSISSLTIPISSNNGAIKILGSTNITITNSIVQGLQHSPVYCASSTVTMKNISVLNNYLDSSVQQSAVHGDTGCSFMIDRSIMSNNTFYYAALGVNSGYSTTVTNSIFTNNRCTDNGAAIVSTANAISISSNYFSNNYSPNNGGAVSVDQAYLYNNTFVSNRAGLLGGAIFFQSGGSSTKNTFHSNAASNGGGYSCYSSSNSLMVDGDTFINNTASISGGAFHTQSTIFTVTSATFINNTSPYGGAMTLYQSEGTVFNSNYYGNTATFLVLEADVNFHSITVNGSSYTTSTDASVMLMSTGRVNMINSKIYANQLPNTATPTYIIQVDDGVFTLMGGNFTGNSKQDSGIVSAASVTSPDLAYYTSMMGYARVMVSGTNVVAYRSAPYIYSR
ncbi:polymorphic outer membrane protein [Planoprotostelium fungivorum]|uniref:Polymorphic outer membrane protein n=1 Tax=Planoprotostelium fungivorum TaxID=1890364 RepID=A0A2P6NLS9_9EUKA|nr:polymorphic outer membrane protein [Planoprotostelium fungivorum]